MKSQSEANDFAAVPLGKTEKERTHADTKKVNYVIRDESHFLHRNQSLLVKAELDRIAERNFGTSYNITQCLTDICASTKSVIKGRVIMSNSLLNMAEPQRYDLSIISEVSITLSHDLAKEIGIPATEDLRHAVFMALGRCISLDGYQLMRDLEANAGINGDERLVAYLGKSAREHMDRIFGSADAAWIESASFAT